MKRARLESVLLHEGALGQAMADLSRAAGLSPRLLPPPTPPSEALADELLLDRWIEATGAYFAVEAESVETTFAKVEETLARCAPCVIRILPSGDRGGIVAVLESSREDLVVVLPGQVRRRIATAEVAVAMRGRKEMDVGPLLSQWTSSLPLTERAKQRAYRGLLLELAGSETISGIWLVRPKPGARFLTQIEQSGDFPRMALFVGLTVAQISLSLLAWSSLFDAALTGRLELSPLIRWVLLALSVALLEVVRSFVVGRMNVSLAAILKRRVLAGALHLDPNEIRARGSGGLLALISEAEVLETAGLAALVSVVSAALSLLAAGFVLHRGAGGGYHVVLLVVWSALTVVGMLWMASRTRRWVDFRLKMTNRLVERMVGHRTRMAQEKPEHRHEPEDAELELYLAESRRMDALARLLQGLPSRGWLLCGLLCLLPALWDGADTGATLIAVGGLFQAQIAFGDIATTVGSLLNLAVAWERAGPLFKAAAIEERHGLPAAAVQELGAERERARTEGELDVDFGTVLEARRVSFRYHRTGAPVLSGVNLRVRRGDRILLEGPSGGGKSTLASLLAGLRDPDSGLVIHQGLDRGTIGSATWRRKVATVPQFHENYVLSGSLLYNLLLGRRWPATAADREAATKVCESLGLGPLVARMPAGLEQIVGETGWQLSHGERTRVYLARALLQGGEVVVVDESFGALDPHTLRTAIDATCGQAPTLVVIAHP